MSDAANKFSGNLGGRLIAVCRVKRHLAPIMRTTLDSFTVTNTINTSISSRHRPSTRRAPASSTPPASSTSRRRHRRRPPISASRRRRRRSATAPSTRTTIHIRDADRTWRWWRHARVTSSTPCRCRRRWAQDGWRQTWGNWLSRNKAQA